MKPATEPFQSAGFGRALVALLAAGFAISACGGSDETASDNSLEVEPVAVGQTRFPPGEVSAAEYRAQMNIECGLVNTEIEILRRRILDLTRPGQPESAWQRAADITERAADKLERRAVSMRTDLPAPPRRIAGDAEGLINAYDEHVDELGALAQDLRGEAIGSRLAITGKRLPRAAERLGVSCLPPSMDEESG